MIKIIILKGVPGSGKSTWAKSFIAKDPNNYARINNDEIRAMYNDSVFSSGYEKMISEIRNQMIKTAIKHNKNIIIDNLNIDPKHFTQVCELVKEANIDAEVSEMPFYIELEEAIERDSKRSGKACVGPAVINKWYKASGGKQFQHYKPKVEIFFKKQYPETLIQDSSLNRAVIFDNDGTISLIHKDRTPYNASTCDQDLPHEHVIECLKLYHKSGYKIIFVSGREEKDRAPTERFYQKYLPGIEYELYMRPTGEQKKDFLVKEEIYNKYIKGKYFVSGWFDDRLQVSKWVYNAGLPLFRVNDPEACF